MEWKTGGLNGLEWDFVGCASGRGTSPVPITLEISRREYGIRFLDRMDSGRKKGNTATPEEVGEIGDKRYPEPQVVAILSYCMNVCVIAIMYEWTLYL